MNRLQLFWLRHGIAEDKRPGQDDGHRRLTQEGLSEVRFVGSCLKRMDLDFDYVFTSPLARAMETAQAAASQLGIPKKVETCEGLLPEDNWEILRLSLKPRLPFEKILLVGHQPSFGRMIGHLVQPHGGLEIPVKKAGVCRVDIDGLGQNPQGELIWLLNPKVLRRLRAS